MKNTFLFVIIALISAGCNTNDVSTPEKTLQVAYQAYIQNDDQLLASVYSTKALSSSFVSKIAQLEASYDVWNLGESQLLSTEKDQFGRTTHESHQVDIFAKKHDQVSFEKVLTAVVVCKVKQPTLRIMAYPTTAIPTHGYGRPMYYAYGYAYTGGSTVNEKEKDLKRQYAPQAPYYISPEKKLPVHCSILTIKNVNNKR